MINKQDTINALKAMADAPTEIEIVSETRCEDEQATIYVFNFDGGTSICVVYDNAMGIFTPCDWQALQSGFTDGVKALHALEEDNWMFFHASFKSRNKAIIVNGFPRLFVIR